MAIKDYDRMIDMIEEQITLENDQISKLVCSSFGMDQRRASELFQHIDSKQRPLKTYIRDRKILRALEECVAGRTVEAVCEKYNIKDVSNFHRGIKRIDPNKKLSDFRREKYVCPSLVHIKEILKGEGMRMIEPEEERCERNRVAFEIEQLLSERFLLEKELSDARFKITLAYEDRIKQGKMELTQETQDAAFGNLTSDPAVGIDINTYKTFLELENARVIFGFSVPQILSLYQESIRRGKDFYGLCCEAHDSFSFDLIKRESEPVPQYDFSEEMDAGEAWNYYMGDDNPDELPPDPYSPTDEELLEYQKERDELAMEFEYNEYYGDITADEEEQVDRMLEQLEAKREKEEKEKELQIILKRIYGEASENSVEDTSEKEHNAEDESNTVGYDVSILADYNIPF